MKSFKQYVVEDLHRHNDHIKEYMMIEPDGTIHDGTPMKGVDGHSPIVIKFSKKYAKMAKDAGSIEGIDDIAVKDGWCRVALYFDDYPAKGPFTIEFTFYENKLTDTLRKAIIKACDIYPVDQYSAAVFFPGKSGRSKTKMKSVASFNNYLKSLMNKGTIEEGIHRHHDKIKEYMMIEPNGKIHDGTPMEGVDGHSPIVLKVSKEKKYHNFAKKNGIDRVDDFAVQNGWCRVALYYDDYPVKGPFTIEFTFYENKFTDTLRKAIIKACDIYPVDQYSAAVFFPGESGRTKTKIKSIPAFNNYLKTLLPKG